MNKIVICGLGALLITACSSLEYLTHADSTAPVQTKMKACLVSDANTRLQAGTLFNKGIKETASDMVSVCMKKLALESAGISAESQSTAQAIISNLQNLSAVNQ